jgi:futalosine hydrolase
VDGRLMTMFDLNLWNAALPPWAGEQMYNPGRWISRPMPVASGMTVNRIPGTMAGQLELANRFDFDIETMEGAGVFYAALSLDVHFTSLRGISNLIEPRDKSRWQLSSAVDAVCAVAMEEVAAYMHL